MKKTITHNLLERFRDYHWDILRFFHDFDVPFDNNLLERDNRMTKVKQKISGGGNLQWSQVLCREERVVGTVQKRQSSIANVLKYVFGDKQIQRQLVGAAG